MTNFFFDNTFPGARKLLIACGPDIPLASGPMSRGSITTKTGGWLAAPAGFISTISTPREATWSWLSEMWPGGAYPARSAHPCTIWSARCGWSMGLVRPI